MKDDMQEVDAQLFPVEELHVGELNPMIGRRIFSHKLGKLKQMRRQLTRPKEFAQAQLQQGPNRPWTGRR